MSKRLGWLDHRLLLIIKKLFMAFKRVPLWYFPKILFAKISLRKKTLQCSQPRNIWLKIFLETAGIFSRNILDHYMYIIELRSVDDKTYLPSTG